MAAASFSRAEESEAAVSKEAEPADARWASAAFGDWTTAQLPFLSGVLSAIEGRVRADWPGALCWPRSSDVNIGNEPETR